jgi:hypothetical protein
LPGTWRAPTLVSVVNACPHSAVGGHGGTPPACDRYPTSRQKLLV